MLLLRCLFSLIGVVHKPEVKIMATLVGKVKWFNEHKGFGFIEGPDNQDIFVHYSAITADGYRTLADGDLVEYEAAAGPKGIKAVCVRRVSTTVQEAS